MFSFFCRTQNETFANNENKKLSAFNTVQDKNKTKIE